MSATRLDSFTFTFTADATTPDFGQPINFGGSLLLVGSLGGGTLFLDFADGQGDYFSSNGVTGYTSTATPISFANVWVKGSRLRLVGSTNPNLTAKFVFNDNGQ